MNKLPSLFSSATRMLHTLLRLPALLGVLLAAVTVFFACHLTTTPESESTFTFPTLKDSIKTADSAFIVLKAPNGQVIDTLFHDAVTLLTRFEDLEAPNYKGGKVLIHIEATKDGKLIYKVERGYDPAQGGDLETEKVIYVSPSVAVKLEWATPKLKEGDSVPFPSVTVLPPNFANKTLRFTSRNPGVLLVDGAALKALTPGSSRLVVWLVADTTRRDSLLVEVVARPAKAIDSLILSLDTMKLALRGPLGRFQVRVVPATASSEVTWSLVDGNSVQLGADGTLTALSEGLSRIAAVSKLDVSVSDTAFVKVLPAVQVDSVRFEKVSTDLFVGGAAESLLVNVYPPLAPPGITLEVQDPTVVGLTAGKAQGLKEGETWVVVQSTEDPSKKDTLKVLVFPAEKVDSLRLKEDSLKLYVNGESRSLTATLYPASLKPRFTWRSTQSTIALVDANGKVTPGIEGKTFVTVLARADSTKKDSALIVVKKDTPHLKVGGDTLIARGTSLAFAPEATQDYGLVVLFKWDLNGDGVYEDSAQEVRTGLSFTYTEAKEYPVRFYVKDTEGNDTTVVRKVKAVDGRVVQITSHKDGQAVRETPITVTWSVDGISQSNTHALTLGANTVSRSAQDAAGNVYSHTLTVHLDQTAPNRPTVKGPLVPVNTLTPQWTWSSGGNGGNGTYRFRLGDPDLTGVPSTTDTFHTASKNLEGGTHTLYVQERDEAGNWSASGSFAIRIDTTAPKAPTMSLKESSPTREMKPTWNWTGGLGDAYRFYRYKLDNDDFRAGTKDTVGTGFSPTEPLTNGPHILYVQERDSAGNWSATASATIVLDNVAPAAPTVSVAPAALTNDPTPTWSWTTATTGTVNFRFKLNNSDLSTGATTTTLKDFTPDPGLQEGTYTLYVQEGDAAGNWSLSGSRQVRIDLTPPTAPRIDSTPYSPLNSLRPKFTWRSGTGGIKVFRSRVDTANLDGVQERTDSTYSPSLDLVEGPHTVYVQERDSAGNWSSTSARSLNLSSRRIIGTSGFSSSEINIYYSGLQFSRLGELYTAYQEISGQSVVVKKFSAGTWSNLGNPALYGTYRWTKSLAISPSGIPHIVVGDSANKATVLRYVQGGWELVGPPGFTEGAAGEAAIAFSPSGLPYIAFRDAPIGKTSVQRYNGSTWEVVGQRGISNGFSIFHSFVFTKSGVPFVAYLDNTEEQDGISIRRLRNSDNTWEPVSKFPVHSKSSSPIDLVVGNGDTVYIALQASESGEGEVYKLNGNSWERVGGAIYPSESGDPPSFAVDSAGTKYVAYRDIANSNRISVKTLKNNSWIPVGPMGFTTEASSENFLSALLSISPDGVPHILFSDVANSKRATVIRTSFDP